jgi:hypothetical protein
MQPLGQSSVTLRRRNGASLRRDGVETTSTALCLQFGHRMGEIAMPPEDQLVLNIR